MNMILRKWILGSRECRALMRRISTNTPSSKVEQLLKQKNAQCNAFVSFIPDSVEGQKANGPGPLAGRMIGVKDNICTKDMPTTCSSDMLAEFRSPFNATVVSLLDRAGARIIGKTNCDEFGMGSYNIHSSHGEVCNPYNAHGQSGPFERHSAGGSSGGSAAAVAAGMCFAALGTDTGGSIRLPAAYCGVAGLKPSYGLISRWGVVSYADSLDCVGILARNASDIATIFPFLSQYDANDSSAIPPNFRTRAQTSCNPFMDSPCLTDLQAPLRGLKIGVPQEYFPAEFDPASTVPFRKMIDLVRSLGASVKPVSLPMTRFALSAYYVISSAEASSNLARYDGIRYGQRTAPSEGLTVGTAASLYAQTRARFGPEVRKRMLLGTYALTAGAYDNYFLQAQRVRKLVKADFDRIFRAPNVLAAQKRGRVDKGSSAGVDILLHPSAIGTAPTIREATKPGIHAYVQDVLTVPASLAGLPALSVPAGLAANGWPMGVSIVAQWGYDDLVLEVGKVLQEYQ